MESIKDIFRRKSPEHQAKKAAETQANLAEVALKAIHDGVVITDHKGVVQSINPAAVTMTESGSADHAIGLDYGLVIKLESKEGRELSDQENPLIQAMTTGKALEPVDVSLISGKSGKRIPVAIAMLPAEGLSQNRIITFRDITRELEEEGEQTEFISTASHEMRTPVATIDGYLSLALNPQTATLDDRARGYLEAAQKASKHLGKLFQDLLDVTKLDDGKIRPHFEPAEMTELIKSISDGFIPKAQENKITYTFGSREAAGFDPSRRLDQVVYGFVDVNFMREIMDNLIENALKYTPSGGSVYVNVRGDGDRVLINVTDTGIGISADDLTHIFQKFYRADNSDTREIGGNGLGLYLVKQRVEAMGGRVWAESGFGEGSTFFVSLPRLTQDEYDKRMIAVNNAKLQPQPQAPMTPVATTVPDASVAPVKLATPTTPVAPVAPVAPATSAPAKPEPAETESTKIEPIKLAEPAVKPATPAPVIKPGDNTTIQTKTQAPLGTTSPAPPGTTPVAPTLAATPQPSLTNNNNLNGEAK